MELVCNYCNWSWNTKSLARLVSCPGCLNKVKTTNSNLRIDSKLAKSLSVSDLLKEALNEQEKEDFMRDDDL